MRQAGLHFKLRDRPSLLKEYLIAPFAPKLIDSLPLTSSYPGYETYLVLSTRRPPLSPFNAWLAVRLWLSTSLRGIGGVVGCSHSRSTLCISLPLSDSLGRLSGCGGASGLRCWAPGFRVVLTLILLRFLLPCSPTIRSLSRVESISTQPV